MLTKQSMKRDWDFIRERLSKDGLVSIFEEAKDTAARHESIDDAMGSYDAAVELKDELFETFANVKRIVAGDGSESSFEERMYFQDDGDDIEPTDDENEIDRANLQMNASVANSSAENAANSGESNVHLVSILESNKVMIDIQKNILDNTVAMNASLQKLVTQIAPENQKVEQQSSPTAFKSLTDYISDKTSTMNMINSSLLASIDSIPELAFNALIKDPLMEKVTKVMDGGVNMINNKVFQQVRKGGISDGDGFISEMMNKVFMEAFGGMDFESDAKYKINQRSQVKGGVDDPARWTGREVQIISNVIPHLLTDIRDNLVSIRTGFGFGLKVKDEVYDYKNQVMKSGSGMSAEIKAEQKRLDELESAADLTYDQKIDINDQRQALVNKYGTMLGDLEHHRASFVSEDADGNVILPDFENIGGNTHTKPNQEPIPSVIEQTVQNTIETQNNTVDKQYNTVTTQYIQNVKGNITSNIETAHVQNTTKHTNEKVSVSEPTKSNTESAALPTDPEKVDLSDIEHSTNFSDVLGGSHKVFADVDISKMSSEEFKQYQLQRIANASGSDGNTKGSMKVDPALLNSTVKGIKQDGKELHKHMDPKKEGTHGGEDISKMTAEQYKKYQIQRVTERQNGLAEATANIGKDLENEEHGSAIVRIIKALADSVFSTSDMLIGEASRQLNSLSSVSLGNAYETKHSGVEFAKNMLGRSGRNTMSMALMMSNPLFGGALNILNRVVSDKKFRDEFSKSGHKFMDKMKIGSEKRSTQSQYDMSETGKVVKDSTHGAFMKAFNNRAHYNPDGTINIEKREAAMAKLQEITNKENFTVGAGINGMMKLVSHTGYAMAAFNDTLYDASHEMLVNVMKFGSEALPKLFNGLIGTGRKILASPLMQGIIKRTVAPVAEVAGHVLGAWSAQLPNIAKNMRGMWFDAKAVIGSAVPLATAIFHSITDKIAAGGDTMIGKVVKFGYDKLVLPIVDSVIGIGKFISKRMLGDVPAKLAKWGTGLAGGVTGIFGRMAHRNKAYESYLGSLDESDEHKHLSDREKRNLARKHVSENKSIIHEDYEKQKESHNAEGEAKGTNIFTKFWKNYKKRVDDGENAGKQGMIDHNGENGSGMIQSAFKAMGDMSANLAEKLDSGHKLDEERNNILDDLLGVFGVKRDKSGGSVKGPDTPGGVAPPPTDPIDAFEGGQYSSKGRSSSFSKIMTLSIIDKKTGKVNISGPDLVYLYSGLKEGEFEALPPFHQRELNNAIDDTNSNPSEVGKDKKKSVIPPPTPPASEESGVVDVAEKVAGAGVMGFVGRQWKKITGAFGSVKRFAMEKLTSGMVKLVKFSGKYHKGIAAWLQDAEQVKLLEPGIKKIVEKEGMTLFKRFGSYLARFMGSSLLSFTGVGALISTAMTVYMIIEALEWLYDILVKITGYVVKKGKDAWHYITHNTDPKSPSNGPNVVNKTKDGNVVDAHKALDMDHLKKHVVKTSDDGSFKYVGMKNGSPVYENVRTHERRIGDPNAHTRDYVEHSNLSDQEKQRELDKIRLNEEHREQSKKVIDSLIKGGIEISDGLQQVIYENNLKFGEVMMFLSYQKHHELSEVSKANHEIHKDSAKKLKNIDKSNKVKQQAVV